MALKYTCSTETARDFASQCTQRLDALEFDLECGRAALTFWAVPNNSAPVTELLRELVIEYEHHTDALAELFHRLNKIALNSATHEHLTLPLDHYKKQLRLRLFPESLPDDDDKPPEDR